MGAKCSCCFYVLSVCLPVSVSFVLLFFFVVQPGGTKVGERGSGSGDLPARDGAVPRSVPALPDQGPRQARRLQAGEITLVWCRFRYCLAWLGLAWLGLAWPGLAWLAWLGLACFCCFVVVVVAAAVVFVAVAVAVAVTVAVAVLLVLVLLPLLVMLFVLLS